MKPLEKMIELGAIGLLAGCVETSGPRDPGDLVKIQPDYPNENKDLVCKVDSEIDGPFTFKWYLRGDDKPIYNSTGKKSWLDKGFTRQDDVIYCLVYVPIYQDSLFIDYDFVYIE